MPVPPGPRVDPVPPPPVDDIWKTVTYMWRSPKGRVPTPYPPVLQPLGMGLPPASSVPPYLPAPVDHLTCFRFAQSAPSMVPPTPVSPIDHLTQSKADQVVLAMAASGCHYPSAVISNMDVLVLDHDTGLSIEYRQLFKHPKYQ